MYCVLVVSFFLCLILVCFFFFKQKTAYEMRISDWSSDVCSSDLSVLEGGDLTVAREVIERDRDIDRLELKADEEVAQLLALRSPLGEIGRASCRDRVCQYV